MKLKINLGRVALDVQSEDVKAILWSSQAGAWAVSSYLK